MKVRVAATVVAAVVAAGCSGGGTEAPRATTTPSPTADSTGPGSGGSPGDLAPLPEPRTEVAGTAWDGRIVVGGGLLPDRSATARIDLYDPDTDAWERLPDMPRALHHHGYVVVDGELWVVGGYETVDDQWVPTDRVWRLAAPDADWVQGPSLTVPRGGLAVVATGSQVWAIGGVGPDGTHRTTERLADGAWAAGPDLAETREHVAAAARGDDVVVIAGRDGGMDTNRASTELLTGDAASPGPELAVARGGIAAATLGEVVCVAGGETPEGTVAEVECLEDGSWRVAFELVEPRHGLAVVALGNRLHVIGGGPTPGLSVSGSHETFVLDPAS